MKDIDGLFQERRNSSVLAMELHFPCTNPSIYWLPKLTYVTSDDLVLSATSPPCLNAGITLTGWLVNCLFITAVMNGCHFEHSQNIQWEDWKSSAKWQPFCLSLIVLKTTKIHIWQEFRHICVPLVLPVYGEVRSQIFLFNFLTMLNFSDETNIYLQFIIILPQWHDTGNWNPSLCKIRNYLFYIVSIIFDLHDSTKPLPEPVLTNNQWGLVPFNWEQFHIAHYFPLPAWKFYF